MRAKRPCFFLCSVDQTDPKQRGDTGPAAACGHGPAIRLPNQLFCRCCCVSVGVGLGTLRCPMYAFDGMWRMPAEMLWSAWGLGLPKCYGSLTPTFSWYASVIQGAWGESLPCAVRKVHV